MNIPVKLDVAHLEIPKVQPLVIRQGETGAVTLKITVTENGKPFDLTGHKAFFLATRPDQAVVSESCAIEQPSKGTMSYTLPAAIAGVAGNISLAYVEIRKGSTLIATTDDLPITVRRRIDMTAVEAKSVVSEIEKLKELLHGVIDSGSSQLVNQQKAFDAAQADKASKFAASQSERATTFSASESSRQSSYTASEKARQDTFSAAELERVTGESVRKSAEGQRATSEAGRVSTEGSRVSVESLRVKAEAARASVEATRVSAESSRVSVEGARVNAESTRAASEAARVLSEGQRATSESTRAANEAARKTAETGRVKADDARTIAEAARVTEFEQIRQNAQKMRNVLLQPGQYDANGVPTINGEQGVSYYVPAQNSEIGNRYVEWQCLLLTDGTESWERVGSSDNLPEEITTADIDAVMVDGSPTGTRYLSLSSMKYWWAKLKTYFAPKNHADASGVYGLSTASLYGHAKASQTSPKPHGAAALGSEAAMFARGDHVHPLQTNVTGSSGSCSGNAATSSKLLTARSVALSGDVAGSASFDGSANVSIAATIQALSVEPGMLDRPYLSLSVKNVIGASTNLNVIKTPGTHVCASDATAQTIVNSPTGGLSFTLVVDWVLSSATYLRQTVTPYSSTLQYVRISTNAGATWGAWQQVSVGAGTVGSSNLADSSVTSAKVAAAAIDATKLNATLLKRITDMESAWDSISQYSTAEVNTGKIWINGKPIYRKVINVGGVYANTQPKTVAHGIAPLGTILSLTGCADGCLVLPLTFTDAGMHSNWGVGLSADATNVRIFTGLLVGLTNTVVVIEYTK